MAEKQAVKNTGIGKEGKLISVIVPVYNVEAYLDACLQSVLCQKYENFELILVDDCSADQSGILCDAYAKKDPRIRVVHKRQNEGLSCARNTGVKLSCGDYLCFVDSDDYILPDYLKILYENAVLYDADVSWCSFFSFEEKELNGGEDQMPAKWVNSRGGNENLPRILTKQKLYEYLTETSIGHKKPEFAVAWNKLIRRQLALELLFPPGRLHEDEFYINDLVEKAGIVVETDARLYGYRQRKDSITGREHQDDIRHLDVLDAVQERVCRCRRLDSLLYERSLKAYRWAIINQFRTFSSGMPAVKLKYRFLVSFVQYPFRNLNGIKGWVLFLFRSEKFYEKYWR